MTILTWVGSKKALLDFIRPIIESFASPDKTYIEPFLGSGSVLIDILSHKIKFKQYICSDYNRNLIIMFNQIKNNPEELIRELFKLKKEFDSAPNKRDYFHLKRHQYNSIINSDNDLLISSLFIFLNRTSFRGLYSVNKKGFYNTSFGHQPFNVWDSKIMYLHQLFTENNVTFIHDTYENVVNSIPEQCIIYLDPPYYGDTFNKYCSERFDYTKFINTIKDSPHILIISNSIHFKPILQELDLFDNILEVSIRDKINAKHPEKVREEIIVY